MAEQKRNLLHDVYMYGLCKYDALLYLDAYPDCEKAKEYFCQMSEKAECAEREYEEKVGPLTPSGAVDSCGWRWASDPWPWQLCEGGR